LKNCEIIEFNPLGNEDIGYLVALEQNKNIPFKIKRVYYTFKVPSETERGFHAHKELQQVLVCLHGSLKAKCFDGKTEEIYTLDSPFKGIYLGPMLWHEMYGYSSDTVVMVLASDYYEEADYIRDYKEFCSIAGEDLTTKTL
jgi:dTDP-4-dehydrorhamnose 3,5-epimerase-like enzyme